MKTLVSIYDPEAIFWDLNPQWKSFGIIKDLYKKDRSARKNKSSMVMWVISGLEDPQSNYSGMPDDEDSRQGKYQSISADLMGDPTWWNKNKDTMQAYLDLYTNTLYTPALRSLRAWEAKLKERDRVFADTEYLIGITDANGKLVGSNVEILDKMFERTTKIWDQYFKIQELLEGEGAGSNVKGGSMESLGDTGGI